MQIFLGCSFKEDCNIWNSVKLQILCKNRHLLMIMLWLKEIQSHKNLYFHEYLINRKNCLELNPSNSVDGKLIIAAIWKRLLGCLYWQEIEPSNSIYHYHYMILPVLYLGRHLIHDNSNRALFSMNETFYVICIIVPKWLVILKDKKICNFSFIIAKNYRKFIV